MRRTSVLVSTTILFVAQARHNPPASIASEGIAAGSCSWFSRSPPREMLVRFLRSRQSPSGCMTQPTRLFLLDDFSSMTGLGFGFLALHTLLLQALSENRTLLPSSAVIRGEKWRWCDEPPRDYGCYFEPWSSACDRMLPATLVPTPWDADGDGAASLSADVVRLSLTHDNTQERLFRIYRRWMHCIPAVGRSWWWGVSWDILLRFRPWIDRRALDFLRAHGVGVKVSSRAGSMGRGDQSAASEPFAVVVVRHGGKHVEEKLVGVEEYLRPLEGIFSSACFPHATRQHVLLVTETAAVVQNFSSACTARGWNCFWSSQHRFDLNIDPWNPTDPRNVHQGEKESLLDKDNLRSSTAALSRRGGGSGGNGGRGANRGFASTAALMHHIGYHSMLNLAVSQHASALIGSFGSSWSQLTLSMMHRRAGGPVLGCSLRPGWKGDNMYTRFTPEGPADRVSAAKNPAACRRAMAPLCKGGGELMYEGLGITWHL
jgi:hypothetical protein